MSYATLYAITKKGKVNQIKDFKNSWLFCPVVFDLLCDKYTNSTDRIANIREIDKLFYERKITNKSDVVVYGLACSYIFRIREIPEIIKTSDIFAEEYINRYQKAFSRWIEIKEELVKLHDNPNGNEFFVIKQTSVDDNVESWFAVNEDYEMLDYMDKDRFHLEGNVEAYLFTFDDGSILEIPFEKVLEDTE